MLTWKYTIVLNTKGNDNFKHFLLYTYCRNSYTKGKALMACTELSLKQKEGGGIPVNVRLFVQSEYRNNTNIDSFAINLSWLEIMKINIYTYSLNPVLQCGWGILCRETLSHRLLNWLTSALTITEVNKLYCMIIVLPSTFPIIITCQFRTSKGLISRKINIP